MGAMAAMGAVNGWKGKRIRSAPDLTELGYAHYVLLFPFPLTLLFVLSAGIIRIRLSKRPHCHLPCMRKHTMSAAVGVEGSRGPIVSWR